MPAIDCGYTARAQFVQFHKRTERFACIVAHRRAGKTVACINDLQDGALRCQKVRPRFAYLSPFYKQSKAVAWDYLRAAMSPLRALGAEANESELRVDYPNGGQVRLYGGDNADALRGIYLDGVVLDEFADMDPRVWSTVIRPALTDRGGWAVFIGTPKGRNEFFQVYKRAQDDPEWMALELKASETGLVSDHELILARRDMTPEQYAQEFECSFDAAIMGAYFGKEIAEAERAGRIKTIDYDPALPVHTAWDLGIGDSTAIWFFQIAGAEIRVIDHYENHGHALGHYAAVLASKPYRYGTDWVPHDAKVKELGTGRTRVETLIELKRNPRVVPMHKLMDGINAARLTIGRTWFDETRCAEGLEALRQYRADFDEKTRAYKDMPRHDWTSHSADAFRYLAMAWREVVAPAREPPKPKPLPGQVYLPGPPQPQRGVRIRI